MNAGSSATVDRHADESGVNFDARSRRQREHEAAHCAAGYMSGWTINRVSAIPGQNGYCDLSAPAHADPLTVAIMSPRIFLASDAWVRFSIAQRPDAELRYAVVNDLPDPETLLAESGWTEPTPRGSYSNGTDEERALQFCREVTADGVAAGLLLNWIAVEADALVRKPLFARLVMALVEELKKTPEIPGGRVTSICVHAQARHEELLA